MIGKIQRKSFLAIPADQAARSHLEQAAELIVEKVVNG